MSHRFFAATYPRSHIVREGFFFQDFFSSPISLKLVLTSRQTFPPPKKFSKFLPSSPLPLLRSFILRLLYIDRSDWGGFGKFFPFSPSSLMIDEHSTSCTFPPLVSSIHLLSLLLVRSHSLRVPEFRLLIFPPLKHCFLPLFPDLNLMTNLLYPLRSTSLILLMVSFASNPLFSIF